jgi:hypothetical protein
MKPTTAAIRDMNLLPRDQFQPLCAQGADALLAVSEQQEEQLQKTQAELVAAQEMRLLLYETGQQVQQQTYALQQQVRDDIYYGSLEAAQKARYPPEQEEMTAR